MSAAFEKLASEIAQLRTTIEEHKASGDMATVDTKAIAMELESLVQAQVREQQAKAEAARPIRRGEVIGPVGFEHVTLGIVPDGKFAGKHVDDLVFTYWLLEKAASKKSDSVKRPTKELSAALERNMDGAAFKALSATGSGTGDEYVPTGMAATLWNDMFLASKIVPTIGSVPMPNDPFDLPLGWGQLTWRKGTSNTATTATDPTTAKTTLTSTEQVAEVDWSYDLDEDSIIAVLPTLRSDVSRDAAEQMDRFVLNADATDAGTGNINLDDANPADDSYYLSNGQDGLRHLVIVDNTAQSTDINTALTDALMRAGISRLGRYAADVGRLAMVMDAETYVNGMLGLTNVSTVDKYGTQATVLTGELGKYSGIPIIPSSAMLEAEDDGKQSTTGSNNDEGQIVIFHRDMWRVGFRRQLLIELDRDVKKRQFVMVVSFRIAVAARGTRSTATHTSGVHGIVRA